MTMLSNLSFSLKRAAMSALRQAIGPAIGASVVAYFAYYAVQGDRGWLAMRQLESEISTAQSVLKQVTAERVRMDRRAQLLRGDHLDPDMLDERARAMLSLSGPRDAIVTLPPVYDQDDPSAEKSSKSAN